MRDPVTDRPASNTLESLSAVEIVMLGMVLIAIVALFLMVIAAN